MSCCGVRMAEPNSAAQTLAGRRPTSAASCAFAVLEFIVAWAYTLQGVSSNAIPLQGIADSLPSVKSVDLDTWSPEQIAVSPADSCRLVAPLNVPPPLRAERTTLGQQARQRLLGSAPKAGPLAARAQNGILHQVKV